MSDINKYAVISGHGINLDKDLGEEIVDNNSSVINTDFGKTSAPIKEAIVGNKNIFFLSRHGVKKNIPPHSINNRANIAALHKLNVKKIISINTVGVITEDVNPGELAIPSQLIDYTWGRSHSFFNTQLANSEYIDFTDPFCLNLRKRLVKAAKDASIIFKDGGIYGVTQGPRIETAAEVNRFEKEGVDYLGMTAMPEAALSMELDIGYASLCLIVNHAAGRGDIKVHEDIQLNLDTARSKAIKTLKQFFL